MKGFWPWTWHDQSWAIEFIRTLRNENRREHSVRETSWEALIIKEVVAKVPGREGGLQSSRRTKRIQGLGNWLEVGVRWDSSLHHRVCGYQSKHPHPQSLLQPPFLACNVMWMVPSWVVQYITHATCMRTFSSVVTLIHNFKFNHFHSRSVCGLYHRPCVIRFFLELKHSGERIGSRQQGNRTGRVWTTLKCSLINAGHCSTTSSILFPVD